MNKALARLNREEVMWKAKNGMVLSLLELALISGYGYDQWRSWEYRGLPLVEKKISLKRALAWLNKNALVPGGGTSKVFDLCDKMYSALFSIWLDIEFRKISPRERKATCQKLDEIMAEYRQFHHNLQRLRPLAPDEPVFVSPVEDPVETPQLGPPGPQYKSSFTKVEEIALCKAIAGMALNLRELAAALGYSYPTIGQWKRAGLPLIDGKITRTDALVWRKGVDLGNQTQS